MTPLSAVPDICHSLSCHKCDGPACYGDHCFSIDGPGGELIGSIDVELLTFDGTNINLGQSTSVADVKVCSQLWIFAPRPGTID